MGGISTDRGTDLDGSIVGSDGAGLLLVSGLLGAAGDSAGRLGDLVPCVVMCLMAGEREGREGVVMLL